MGPQNARFLLYINFKLFYSIHACELLWTKNNPLDEITVFFTFNSRFIKNYFGTAEYYVEFPYY